MIAQPRKRLRRLFNLFAARVTRLCRAKEFDAVQAIAASHLLSVIAIRTKWMDE